MMNTFGNLYRLTTFGESHGPGIGGVIDGIPAGMTVDTDFLQAELNRRRPGQSAFTTPRKEGDRVELLSGVFEGRTTGCPIGFLVRNENQHSNDYDNLRETYRPSHADYTYDRKYGIRDHRGGGRSSARETISRVVGGAFAKMFLREHGIQVMAYTSQIGDIALTGAYTDYDLSQTEASPVRCPDTAKAAEMEALITRLKGEGDTTGGVITCVIKGCPVGLGEPVFSKLHADLGAAMLGINAVKGFEIGDGFAMAARRGSEVNDIFIPAPDGGITTRTNHSGGVQGGISNGQDIFFRVAFKPIATLLREQETVNRSGEAVTLKARGRHDACVIPRAVPIVEAMAAMVIMDHWLLNEARKQAR